MKNHRTPVAQGSAASARSMKVDELTAYLEGAGSLRERLSLIAKHWSELRKLPRAQREDIAIGMGSRWASQRIMRLMEADGRLTDGERLAKNALEQFGNEDPRELRRLARELKEGNLDGVEEVFIGALGSAVDARAVEVTEAALAEPPPLPVEIEAVALPEPQTSDSLAESAEDLTRVLAAVAAARLDEESEDALEPEPEVETLATVEDAALVEPMVVAESEMEVEADSSPAESAFDDRSSTVTEGRWRLRRSVSARIRDHDYASLDSALEAVSQLALVDRKWCLGDLIEHWPLDPEALAKVLDASPNDRTRTRLATRAMR